MLFSFNERDANVQTKEEANLFFRSVQSTIWKKLRELNTNLKCPQCANIVKVGKGGWASNGTAGAQEPRHIQLQCPCQSKTLIMRVIHYTLEQMKEHQHANWLMDAIEAVKQAQRSYNNFKETNPPKRKRHREDGPMDNFVQRPSTDPKDKLIEELSKQLQDQAKQMQDKANQLEELKTKLDEQDKLINQLLQEISTTNQLLQDGMATKNSDTTPRAKPQQTLEKSSKSNQETAPQREDWADQEVTYAKITKQYRPLTKHQLTYKTRRVMKPAPRNPMEFTRLYFTLPNGTALKDLQYIEKIKVLEQVLKRIGIKRKVALYSIIGRSLVEIYVPNVQQPFVEELLEQHDLTKVEWTPWKQSPFNQQVDNREATFRRLNGLMRRARFGNLRKAIIHDAPEDYKIKLEQAQQARQVGLIDQILHHPSHTLATGEKPALRAGQTLALRVDDRPADVMLALRADQPADQTLALRADGQDDEMETASNDLDNASVDSEQPAARCQ
jgi:ribosomal protein L20A (L18A)